LAAFAGEGEQDLAALIRPRESVAPIHAAGRNCSNGESRLIDSQIPRRLTTSEADVEATGSLGP
jgi:hypothetical protein